MVAIRRWVGSALRHWRIVRHQRKQLLRSQAERREAEHAERVRAGIKDNLPSSL